MSEREHIADSKGSEAPSEAGLRNNLNRTIFLILAVVVAVIAVALGGVWIFRHNNAGLAPNAGYTVAMRAGRISDTSTQLVG